MPSATSLEGFLAANVARPATVASDGWRGYLGLPDARATTTSRSISAPPGATPPSGCPPSTSVFSLAKRWLMGTHHGAVGEKHLPAYLDEYVFRFNRRTAKRISHGFARLIEQAVRTGPTTYHAIVATPA